MRLFAGTIVLILSSCSAIAEDWHIGVSGGYGWYHNSTISNSTGLNPPASGVSGFPARGTVGVVIGEDVYHHWGSEIRWLFQWGGPQFEWNDVKTSLSGFSNLITYDLLIYPIPRESGLRPYLAGGAGVKVYTGTGARLDRQIDTARLAILQSETQAELAISVGGGLKYLFARHAQASIDFRTYLTPTPDNVIRPVGQALVRGWLYDFVPTVGISYRF